MRYRYGPYHEGPDPLAAPYDVRSALDAMGDAVLEGGSPADALRDLLRRGMPGAPDRRGLHPPLPPGRDPPPGPPRPAPPARPPHHAPAPPDNPPPPQPPPPF